MFEPKREDSSLEELKKRLYTRVLRRRPLRESPLPPHAEKISEYWKKENSEGLIMPQPKPHLSLFQKFFIGAGVFFVLAVFYAGYQFFVGGQIVSSRNIEMSVFGPGFTSGGEELTLQLAIENKNNTPLEFAELFIEYPKGAPKATSTIQGDLARISRSLKSISSNSTHQEIVKLVLYGEEGSEKTISFTLNYRIKGSNAIFKKTITYPVRINTAPVNLSMDIPKETNAGQDISLKITLSGNASKEVPGVLLQVEYPPGFLFKKAEPKPTSGTGLWRLGDIKAGGERSIIVTGTLSGEENEERTFRVFAGAEKTLGDQEIDTVYNSLFGTVVVRRPFLEAKLSLNGDDADTVSVPSRRTIQGEIFWKNTLPVKIADASIKIRISGNAFDRSTVSADRGFYDSGQGTITWDKSTMSDFSSVEPGGNGRVSFSFLAKTFNGSVPIGNPEIYFETTVRGETQTSDGGGEVSLTTKKTARVASDAQLVAKAFYSTGPFRNTGPWPPEAEEETTYTIVWTATNSSNDISNTTVSGIIPLAYVSWNSAVSPGSEDVFFDPESGQVSWRLGTLSGGAGYGKAPREVAFQITLKPSITQRGDIVELIGSATLSGTDSFSGGMVSASRPGIGTNITSDPAYTSAFGAVK